MRRHEIQRGHTLDVENATKCDLDHILKYFLYLILEKDSSERKQLDRIQGKVESLQKDRYYKTKNENTHQSRPDGTGAAATKAYEQEMGDHDTISEEEQKLVQRREEILNEILEDVLEKVLPITNIEETRKLLQQFIDKISEARYAPYVILCNYLLNALKFISTGFHVRDPDYLNIQFHRNDPQPIFDEEMGGAPSVIITSLFAALQARCRRVVDSTAFSERPKRKFEWEAILAGSELQVQNKNKFSTDGKFTETSTSTMSFEPRVKHNEVDAWASSIADTDLSCNAELVISSKRLRDDDQDISNSLPGRKKRRDLNSITPILAGPNVNSTVNSTSTGCSQAESQTTEAIDRVKCEIYATEVLSYSVGVHHTINLLFAGDYLRIWYYDRQGILQSNGMSIYSDFPRFVVLLFALQRFNLEDWGIISSLNPKALLAHGLAQEKPEEKLFNSGNSNQQGKEGKAAKGKAKETNDSPLPIVLSSLVVLPLAGNLEHLWVVNDGSLVKVELDMGDFLFHQPHSLAGRATMVVSATGLTEASEKTPMVCKIYHPEVQRGHEGLALRVTHKIAEEHDPGMSRHLPTIYFHADMSNTTTQCIRSMVRRSWKGHRVLRILGLKKLDEITTVDGGQFVKAWLEVVTCHSFLWKHHVEHGDPSVNNMMYDSEARCGVLTDFDLSLFQWEPRVFGTDRTGTIPFITLDLLTANYWNGGTRRFYHHELESFIWILPYVFLLYDNGIRKANPLVDVWTTSDYKTCSENKGHFYTKRVLEAAGLTVHKNFKTFWPLAQILCLSLHKYHAYLDTETEARSTSSISEGLWEVFIEKLQSECAGDGEIYPLVTRLQGYQPSFGEPDATVCKQLGKKFRPILQ